MSVHLLTTVALLICFLLLSAAFYSRRSSYLLDGSAGKGNADVATGEEVVKLRVASDDNNYNNVGAVKRLEVLYLQEVCYNVAESGRLEIMKAVVNKVLNDLVESMRWDAVDVAIGDFCDKPIQPLGQPTVDHCFILHQQLVPWTSLAGKPYRKATYQFAINSGMDVKGNQLDAMISGFYTGGLTRSTPAGSDNASEKESPLRHFLKHGEKNEPNTTVDKLIILLNANPYHVAGDHPLGLRYPKAGLGSYTERKCLMYDYPSEADFIDFVKREDIHVAVVLAQHYALDSNSPKVYERLMKKMQEEKCPSSLVHTAQSDEQMTAVIPKLFELFS